MTAAPATPNFPPAPSTPEAGADADKDTFDFLTVDNIQQMRDEQKRALSQAQKGVDFLDPVAKKAAETAARDRIEEIRKEYLHSFDGLDENDPDFDHYMHVLSTVSIATGSQATGDLSGMPDHEWYNGVFDDDGKQVEPSGRDMVEEYHEHKLEEAEKAAEATTDDDEEGPAPAPVPPVPPAPADNTETQKLFTPEELKDHIDKVDRAAEACLEAYGKLLAARDKLADLTVKRQGRLNDKATPEYKEAHREYHEAMIAYAKAGEALLDAKNGATRDETEKKKTVVEYLLHEAAELRKITNEKWNNTKVNKICMWMARGNLAQRIAKGILVGGGAAAAAALLTAATAGTGTVGILAGGGVAGGLALSRGMRAAGAVRGSELLKGNQEATMTGTGPNALHTLQTRHTAEVHALVDRYGATDAGLEEGASHLHDKHERAIQHEQKKNRKAVFFGLGAIAVGAGAAYVASELADRMSDYADRVHGAYDNMIGDPDPNAPTDASGGNPPIDKESGATPGDTGGSGESTGPDLKELGNKYETMSTIDKGMGGEALFKELGLDPQEWYRHEDALLKAHPEDFYRMPDGHVGLAHPGSLSNETMLDLATRTGMLK